ncbi:NDP-hexose 2,3-dehydratase family protein [Cryptosporangium sp. NPDC051539]|uniref:NDP-hexose 2,3-dehydratase family protein n=1 Tax=Cryptosporangium sp. NPDC051539 TaxID=3363962 RepID=UPI0037BAD038
MVSNPAFLLSGSARVASPFNLGPPDGRVAGDGTMMSEVDAWWSARTSAYPYVVSRIPFAELDGWRFEPESGNLVHETGRFFTVEGLHARGDDGVVWEQPIIHQPEVGILGILVKEFNGVLHCLMQAKMEPGNINVVQLSPTVQATRSNYTRVHRGAVPRFLDYFWGPSRGQILVDVLQSEQGAWFWHKHNRNMVVKTTQDVPEHPDFRWFALDEVRQLLRVDNLVNMDSRTVLSCMPIWRSQETPSSQDAFHDGLLRSYEARGGWPALHTETEILSWFTEMKAHLEWSARLVPLSKVSNWQRGSDELVDDDAARFRVIAVRVEAASREVAGWTQPLLAPCGQGVAAFLARPINGVLHVLAQVRPEPGLLDIAEIAPTVQLPGAAGAGAPEEPAPFVDAVLSADASQIRYDVVQSEEGGRFYHAETRYLVVDVGEQFPLEVPDAFRWLTVRQLINLLRHGHYLNVQARSLLSCLHSLW